MELTINGTTVRIGTPTMRRRDSLRRIYSEQLAELATLGEIETNSPIEQADRALKIQAINDRMLIRVFRIIAEPLEGAAELPPEDDEWWQDVDLAEVKRAVDFFNGLLT